MKIQINLITAFTAVILATDVNAEFITGTDLAKRQHVAPTEEIVKYCRQYSPEIVDGYALFLTNFENAFTAWIDENPEMKQSLQEPIQLDDEQVLNVEKKITEARTKILNDIKQYDPKLYCPLVSNNLMASTPEAILKSFHEYEARVKQYDNK